MIRQIAAAIFGVCLPLYPAVAAAADYKRFVLTGQSNSLGTLATTDTAMLRARPGTHPAEQDMAVPFFWDNRDFYANPTRGFGLRGRFSRDFGMFDSSNSWTNLDAELDLVRVRRIDLRVHPGLAGVDAEEQEPEPIVAG